MTLTAYLIVSASHSWKANEQLIHVCPFIDTHNYTDLHYTCHLSFFHRVKICTLFSHSASGRSSGHLISLLPLPEGFLVLLAPFFEKRSLEMHVQSCMPLWKYRHIHVCISVSEANSVWQEMGIVIRENSSQLLGTPTPNCLSCLFL